MPVGGGQVDAARAERRHVQQRVRPRRDARPRQDLQETRNGQAARAQLQVRYFTNLVVGKMYFL